MPLCPRATDGAAVPVWWGAGLRGEEAGNTAIVVASPIGCSASCRASSASNSATRSTRRPTTSAVDDAYPSVSASLASEGPGGEGNGSAASRTLGTSASTDAQSGRGVAGREVGPRGKERPPQWAHGSPTRYAPIASLAAAEAAASESAAGVAKDGCAASAAPKADAEEEPEGCPIAVPLIVLLVLYDPCPPAAECPLL